MYQFNALSDWLPLVDVQPDSTLEDSDCDFGFVFNGSKYFLSNFARVHDSAWIDDTNYPDYIHGIEEGQLNDPLFIQLNEARDQVKVYEITFTKEVLVK